MEEFVDVDLHGARFVRADLSGVVMREVHLAGADIDAPWLPHAESLRVNGVNVVPLVEAELNGRFPGRADRRAVDPAGLRAAWASIERAWAAALDRAASMPAGTVDVSVGGEWSFAQTLRHLVLATDAWLGKAVLEREQPFHPLGLAFAGAEDEGLDMSVFTKDTPSYAEVLDARAKRVAMVRDFLATVTPDALAEPRRNPWEPAAGETVLQCLHVILEEEWEHLRYATRDLVALRLDGSQWIRMSACAPVVVRRQPPRWVRSTDRLSVLASRPTALPVRHPRMSPPLPLASLGSAPPRASATGVRVVIARV